MAEAWSPEGRKPAGTTTATPNIAAGYIAPQQAAINSGQAQIANQQAYTLGNANLQQGYLQGEAGFQQAGLGLQNQDLQTQLQALNRQFGLLPQYNTLQQQLFGLQGQSIDQSREQLLRNEANQRHDFTGSQAAHGSLTSEGTKRGFSDIEQQLTWGLQDIDRQRNQLEISKQQYGLGYGEKLANLEDQKKFLGTQSQRLGISEQELQFRLQKSLDQLGLSTQLTYQDLVQAGADLNNGIYNPLQSLWTQVAGGAGIPGMGG